MHKIKRPDWMKEKLKDKHIDEILVSLQEFVTDGTIQVLYMYIKNLEKTS